MRKKKDVNEWESAYMNDRTYTQYYNRLTELAISMFEWKNLPPSIDARFLELTLFTDGMAVFFKDEVLGELALQVMISGQLDVYRIPTQRRAYATNGYNKDLTEKDSVIIFNNYLHTNNMLDTEMFARRLYELERTIDVNVNAQKTPVIIQCTENQRATMKNLYKEYKGNEPFIFGDKNLDLNGIKVLNTNAPFVADQLNTLKREYFNEALTYLGISNVNIQKKERLLSDEVTRNMGSIEAQKFTRLNSRKEACKKINEMFDLNIEVDFREDIKVVEEANGEDKGGEDNE
jgi:hypothetical protein